MKFPRWHQSSWLNLQEHWSKWLTGIANTVLLLNWWKQFGTWIPWRINGKHFIIISNKYTKKNHKRHLNDKNSNKSPGFWSGRMHFNTLFNFYSYIRSLCGMKKHNYSIHLMHSILITVLHTLFTWTEIYVVLCIGFICHFLRSILFFRRKSKRNNVKWACDHTIIERLLINYACKIQMTNLNDLFFTCIRFGLTNMHSIELVLYSYNWRSNRCLFMSCGQWPCSW